MILLLLCHEPFVCCFFDIADLLPGDLFECIHGAKKWHLLIWGLIWEEVQKLLLLISQWLLQRLVLQRWISHWLLHRLVLRWYETLLHNRLLLRLVLQRWISHLLVRRWISHWLLLRLLLQRWISHWLLHRLLLQR